MILFLKIHLNQNEGHWGKAAIQTVLYLYAWVDLHLHVWWKPHMHSLHHTDCCWGCHLMSSHHLTYKTESIESIAFLHSSLAAINLQLTSPWWASTPHQLGLMQHSSTGWCEKINRSWGHAEATLTVPLVSLCLRFSLSVPVVCWKWL